MNGRRTDPFTGRLLSTAEALASTLRVPVSGVSSLDLRARPMR